MSKEHNADANTAVEPSRKQKLLEAAEIIGGPLLAGLGLAVSVEAIGAASHRIGFVIGGLATYISGIAVTIDGSRRSNRNVRQGVEVDWQRQQPHEQALGDCDLEVAEFPIIDLTGNDFPDVR